jgi:hypothetical protein
MGLSFLCSVEPVSTKAIMGRDPFGIFIKEGEVHTISYRKIIAMIGSIIISYKKYIEPDLIDLFI